MNDDYYLRIFAENLNHYMRRYNIKQIDLARRVGVNKSTVHEWVYGRKAPRMDKVDIMCQIFNCKKSDLLERQDHIVHLHQLTDGAVELARQYDLLDERDKAFVAGQVSALLAQEKYHTGGAGSSASGE